MDRYKKSYKRLPEFEEAGKDGEEVTTASSITSSDLRNLWEDHRRGSRLAGEAWWGEDMQSDYSAQLHKIDIPVLVVVGMVEMVDREVCGKIKGAEMVVIEKCGHLVPIERPQELAKRIEKFCSKGLEG